MLDESSFALLVLTVEDKISDGSLQARQNVIHEAGLFQGNLGFNRAMILLEEGMKILVIYMEFNKLDIPKIMSKKPLVRYWQPSRENSNKTAA